MRWAIWTTIGRGLSDGGVRAVVRPHEMSDSREKVAIAFTSACARRGLDLAVPFAVSAFNAGASLEERLPDLGREDDLAILLGNTRHFWLVFRAVLAGDRARLQGAHPLDEYVAASVTDAAPRTGVRHELCWGHAMDPRPMPTLRARKSRLNKASSVDSHQEHPGGSEVVPQVVLREEEVLTRNPLDEIEGVGKRKPGKAQLRVDEARRW